MPKIKYVDKKFSPERLQLIAICNQLITEYKGQGFNLTLRQLYYRLVADDLFPADRKYKWTGSKWVLHPEGTNNAQPNYLWLGDIMNDARLAGLVDWHSLEDRTRNLDTHPHWTHPKEVILSASQSYRNDLWRWQPYRVEVWVEKDALEDVVAQACRPLDVPFFSCRGYTSQTAMWDAGQRLLSYRKNRVHYDGPHIKKGGQDFRQKPYILHLGDHDPSGIDMTRDIQERLSLFVGEEIRVDRIALTMAQIEQYNPPPNPAKTTDSRFKKYMAQYGNESWELDALSPNVLVTLIRSRIMALMDKERFAEAQSMEKEGKIQIRAIADRYDMAIQNITGGGNA